MRKPWTYRVGLSKGEVSEEALKKSGLKFEEVEVESAIRSHIDETLGKPYKFYTSMREEAPDFFSCSSLLSYLYTFAGIWMPSLVIDKFFYAEPVDKNDLRFGDIIFSTSSVDTNLPQRRTSVEYMPGKFTADKPITHAVMYLEHGKILNASDTNNKGKVIIELLEESPINQNIVGYGRVANIKEKRYVVEIPDDKSELRNRQNLTLFLSQTPPQS